MALRLEVAPYRLPLARPFATAAVTYAERRGLFVRLVDERDGTFGHGEVAPLPGHGGEPLEAAREALAAVARALAGDAALADPAAWSVWADAKLTDSQCARAGVETALVDLLSTRAGLPLARWLAAGARQAVAVNATIGAVPPTEAALRAAGAIAAGFATIKVKVGDAAGEARVAAVRAAIAGRPGSVESNQGATQPHRTKAATAGDDPRGADAEATESAARLAGRGPHGAVAEAADSAARLDRSGLHGSGDVAGRPPVLLRADANGAWDVVGAAAALSALAVHALELVEQPVAAAAVADLARLRRMGIVPIGADEALELPGGWERVLAAGAADVLVLKPTLLGGPMAALAIAAAARDAGVGVIVTSALDAAVGRTAALHVAAALPTLAGACGLATGGMLAADAADVPGPVHGTLSVPSAPGLGVAPARDGDGAPLTWGAA